MSRNNLMMEVSSIEPARIHWYVRFSNRHYNGSNWFHLTCIAFRYFVARVQFADINCLHQNFCRLANFLRELFENTPLYYLFNSTRNRNLSRWCFRLSFLDNFCDENILRIKLIQWPVVQEERAALALTVYVRAPMLDRFVYVRL